MITSLLPSLPLAEERVDQCSVVGVSKRRQCINAPDSYRGMHWRRDCFVPRNDKRVNINLYRAYQLIKTKLWL